MVALATFLSLRCWPRTVDRSPLACSSNALVSANCSLLCSVAWVFKKNKPEKLDLNTPQYLTENINVTSIGPSGNWYRCHSGHTSFDVRTWSRRSDSVERSCWIVSFAWLSWVRTLSAWIDKRFSVWAFGQKRAERRKSSLNLWVKVSKYSFEMKWGGTHSFVQCQMIFQSTLTTVSASTWFHHRQRGFLSRRRYINIITLYDPTLGVFCVKCMWTTHVYTVPITVFDIFIESLWMLKFETYQLSLVSIA